MPVVESEPPDDRKAPVPREWVAWVTLTLLVVTVVPITLRRPIIGDTAFYQLLARVVERGGVLYRDVLDTNPPGAIWIHAAVRSLLGPTSEALRAFDLVLFGTMALLLGRLIVAGGRPRHVGVWGAVVLAACYGSQSIWCQCQRDVWMLGFVVPAIAIRLARPGDGAGSVATALVEGLLWGMAASMKPFVLVPWLAVELVDRRPSLRVWTAGVLGFLGVAAANVAGVVALGSWEAAVETWMRWNPEYFAARTHLWNLRGVRVQLVHFGPWFAVHLLALPIALGVLVGERDASGERADRVRRVLAALYLGWNLQAIAVQHWHSYVHLPGMLLGFVCVAMEPSLPRARIWWPTVAVFVAAIAWHSPPVRGDQLRHWQECFAMEIPPDVRDDLRGPLDAVYPGAPTSVDLAEVVQYLRSQHMQDGDVLAFGFSMLHVYDELDVLPGCRFAAPRFHAIYFPRRRDEVLAAIDGARPRFVVADLVVEGFDEPGLGERRLVEPRGFPWGHEVVFRAGRYRVLRLDGPLGGFDIPNLDEPATTGDDSREGDSR